MNELIAHKDGQNIFLVELFLENYSWSKCIFSQLNMESSMKALIASVMPKRLLREKKD